MRLLYCERCDGVFKLERSPDPRDCACGRTWGRITERGEVDAGGPCVVLGINDNSLQRAINERPDAGNGPRFYAFVFPKMVYESQLKP